MTRRAPASLGNILGGTMLGGYGNHPAAERLAPMKDSPINLAAVTHFLSGCALNLPPRAEVLAALHQAEAA